jgi:hypothetical protein
MTSGSILLMTGGVVAVSLLALIAVFVVYFSARGPARAGLASVGGTAALVGPVAGIGAASYGLVQAFAGLSLTGAGGSAAVLAGVAEAMLPMRIGFAAAAITLLVAAGLGWIGRGERLRLPPASGRRLVALALPMALAFLLVGSAFEYSRRTRTLIVEVVASPEAKPAAATDTPDAAGEDAPRSSAGIVETSRRIALGVMSGVFGVPVLFLALTGFAAATAILAWRVYVPTAFAAAASAWMVLQAALWTAALFLLRTPAVS